jgi:hypothetical protein
MSSRPPKQLDNADVLAWAWSGDVPFGHLRSADGSVVIAVHGLAVCRYSGSESVYRFTCDKSWSVEQDAPYDTVEQAMTAAEQLYSVTRDQWISYDSTNAA